MNNLHQRALEYITNTGGAISAESFDDDHEPIGPVLREDMAGDKLIIEFEGMVYRIDDNAPRCAHCGYTDYDKAAQLDHHLCTAKHPA